MHKQFEAISDSNSVFKELEQDGVLDHGWGSALYIGGQGSL